VRVSKRYIIFGYSNGTIYDAKEAIISPKENVYSMSGIYLWLKKGKLYKGKLVRNKELTVNENFIEVENELGEIIRDHEVSKYVFNDDSLIKYKLV